MRRGSELTFGCLALALGLALATGCSSAVGKKLSGKGKKNRSSVEKSEGSGEGDPDEGDLTGCAEQKGASAALANLRLISRAELAARYRDAFAADATPALPKLPEMPPEKGLPTERTASKLAAVQAEDLYFFALELTQLTLASAATDAVQKACASPASCAAYLAKVVSPIMAGRALDAGETALLEGSTGAAATPVAIAGKMLTTYFQSPWVLYPELPSAKAGAKTEGDCRPLLASADILSRIARAAWGTGPDAAAFDELASGDLTDADARSAALKALLGNEEKSGRGLALFTSAWLDLDKLGGRTVFLDDGATTIDGETQRALRQQTLLLVQEVVKRRLPFNAIFDPGFAFLSKRGAELYGIAPKGEPAVLYEAAEIALISRAGQSIVGQQSLSLLLSNPLETNPVHRGLYVLERFLCRKIGSPPKEIQDEIANAKVQPGQTPRQFFETTHNRAACEGCHKSIDPVGLAFEQLDRFGRGRGVYQINGAAVPVDASGKLQLGDGEVSFDNLDELVTAMKASAATQRCIASKVARYSLGAATWSELDDELWGTEGLKSLTYAEILDKIVRSPAFIVDWSRGRREQ